MPHWIGIEPVILFYPGFQYMAEGCRISVNCRCRYFITISDLALCNLATRFQERIAVKGNQYFRSQKFFPDQQLLQLVFCTLLVQTPDNWMVQAWSGYNVFFVWFLMLDGAKDHLLDDGIAKARRAVRLQPSAPLARDALGWNLIKAGRVNEGLMHYRASLGMNPYDAVA